MHKHKEDQLASIFRLPPQQQTTYVQVPPAEVSTSSKKGSPTRLSRASSLSKMQDYVYRKLILTIGQDLFLYLYGDTVVL